MAVQTCEDSIPAVRAAPVIDESLPLQPEATNRPCPIPIDESPERLRHPPSDDDLDMGLVDGNRLRDVVKYPSIELPHVRRRPTFVPGIGQVDRTCMRLFDIVTPADSSSMSVASSIDHFGFLYGDQSAFLDIVSGGVKAPVHPVASVGAD